MKIYKVELRMTLICPMVVEVKAETEEEAEKEAMEAFDNEPHVILPAMENAFANGDSIVEVDSIEEIGEEEE